MPSPGLTSPSIYDVLLLFFSRQGCFRGLLMNESVAATEAVLLTIHNEDDNAVGFVRALLQKVFGKSEREAIELTAEPEEYDRIECGPYPAPVAAALLESAQQFIRTSRHPLLITSEAVRTHECDLCGAPQGTTEFLVTGRTAYLCSECLMLARQASDEVPGEEFRFAYVALNWHFAGIPQLATRTRQFPGHMRADVQTAIDRLFAAPLHFFGLHEEYRYETLSFTRLMKQKRYPPAIAPPLYRDIDIGEHQPMKCLENGLWLCRSDELRYAVLL